MDTIAKYCRFAALGLCLLFMANRAAAQVLPDDIPQAKAIISAMENSVNQWDQGKLVDFMTMYDPSATMMMPGGTVGLDSIRGLYQYKYFKGNMPKQNLRYTDMKVRMLGDGYALLTGAFTLYGNGLPDRSGRYSLVMMLTKSGWKIMHDHSG